MSIRGLSLPRLEDARFLTGRGRYVEDIDVPGQAWMQVVRSPHAHAMIARSIRGRARPAWRDRRVHSSRPRWPGCAALHRARGERCAHDRAASPRAGRRTVRHVGDPVAFVVAETRFAARDAAESCRGLGHLPSVVDGPAALLPGAPQLWDKAQGKCRIGSRRAIRLQDRQRWRGRTYRGAGASQQSPGDLFIENARCGRPGRQGRLSSVVLRRWRASTAVSACG